MDVAKIDAQQVVAAYDRALRDLTNAEQSGDARALTAAGRAVAELQAAHPELVDRVESGRRASCDGSDMVTVALGDGISLRAHASELESTKNLGKALLAIHNVLMQEIRNRREPRRR